jgi:tetratricopeptide (TPR) repeat protein
MTMRSRSDTEARASGFDATLEAGFNWVLERLRWVLMLLGVALVVGAGLAISHDRRTQGEDDAQLALRQVEAGFSLAMGSPAEEIWVAEPANPEQAQRGREEALARFEAVSLEHPGTRAARLADLRAAEMEVELERWADAETRLSELVSELDEPDLLEQAALPGLYPAAGSVWLQAGASFARAGAIERSVGAYQKVLSTNPELAEQSGVLERLSELAALAR